MKSFVAAVSLLAVACGGGAPAAPSSGASAVAAPFVAPDAFEREWCDFVRTRYGI